jgi:V-type H+-transporting ATPase subunit a
MGSLFRSENMSLLRLYFERSAAHDTVDELGKLGLVQFNDLNPDASTFQRAFSGNVRLCDDMQRRIRFLYDQIAADETLGPDATAAISDADVLSPDFRAKSDAVRLDDLDVDLSKLETRFLQMNNHWDSLRMQQNQLVELKNVLHHGAVFFSNSPRVATSSYGSLSMLTGQSPSPTAANGGLYASGSSGSATSSILMEEGGSSAGNDMLSFAAPASSAASALLNYVSGVLPTDKVQPFERILYRATRGNCHARFADILDPLIDPGTGQSMQKTVFMLFFSGSEVMQKVTKVCSAFDANRYPFPDSVDAQWRASAQCEERLADLRSVIQTTAISRASSLGEVAKQLPVWSDKIMREKSIYHTLNMLNFDTSNALFIAEVWAPSFALTAVNTALNIGRRRSHAQVPSVLEDRTVSRSVVPPTYFKTNKFTQVFQDIVESYGVAEYHEVNPAPFTVVTFPFLFAVMFGDVAHGSLMFLFALYVVLNEKRMNRRKLNEFMVAIYDGRYMILLMGFFSIFTGAIYNEFFAVPLDLFGSRWKYTADTVMACGIDNCAVATDVRAPLAPYPFGFDPVWKGSENGLVFFNSYKMKLSIVLGVCQMVMGIVMSYKNATFHKRPLDVWHVFIPQMIFMNAIFGYLVIIIILKWAINWDSPACRLDPNCIAPDLKTVLINMFMSPSTVAPRGQLFTGQAIVQNILLLAALMAVPWMLLPKPLILKARHDKKVRDAYRPLTDDGESAELLGVSASGKESHDHDDDFNFADIFVNQMIHTIEFVLGAVSNTASYLRLWALSLAHAELSDVFLEKLLYMTFETGSSIAILIGFFLWVAATLGVLMFMESLSAFLHALRLHWVEFQNKFYNLHASGKAFVPFNFNYSMEDSVGAATA